MNINNVRYITTLFTVAGTLLLGAAGRAQNCVPVSGTISTNFIDQTTTVGTATGDLAGGVSAVVQSVTPGPNGKITFSVVHRFVNAAGDHIISEPSEAVAIPSAESGVLSLTFAGMELVGKTGSFEGATGSLKLFGGANLDRGEVVVRYRGQICYAAAKK